MSLTEYCNSKITIRETDFIVPLWILNDVGYFYDEIYDWIKCENEIDATFDICHVEKFTQLRKQIYWLCNWYNGLIEFGVPVIKSEIFCIDKNLENNFESVLTKILVGNDLKFLRLCNASPKDISTCIVNCNSDINEIINIFKTSHRTSYMLDSDHIHLVARPHVKIDYELRCFWHNNNLRAVSGPEYYVNDIDQENIKNIIKSFFQTYGEGILHNSATIDIGICDNEAFIIEFNSFGSDMLAGAEHFNWKSDFMTLFNSEEPVFKFKNEFAW